MKELILRIIPSICILLFGTSSLFACEKSIKFETIAPIDESSSSTELQNLIERLRIAVSNNDHKFVESKIDESFISGFGPIEEKGNSQILDGEAWLTLESSISFGGAFTGNGDNQQYCMPYFYAKFPGHLDPYEYQVVIKSGSKILLSKTQKVIDIPDYSLLKSDFGAPKIIRDDNDRKWSRVYIGTREAYIPSGSIRSPIGGRVCLKQFDDEWRITSIISGD